MTETSTTILEKDQQNEELSSTKKMIEKSKNIDKSEECPTCDCICPNPERLNPKNLFTKQDLKNNEIVATNNNNRGGPGSNPTNSFESSWTARPLIHQQNSNDQLIQRTFDDSKASFNTVCTRELEVLALVKEGRSLFLWSLLKQVFFEAVGEVAKVCVSLKSNQQVKLV